MRVKRILILGGTHEARALANLLVEQGHDVTTSFAGVTESPLLPKGKIRRGGFGGVDGMRDHLVAEKIDVMIDAAHPFAAIISQHAFQARGNVHLLRFERSAWVAQDGDNWVDVPNIAAAVVALPFEARALLTIGRKEVSAFVSRPDLSGVARMIEPPPVMMPAHWQLVLERPPFTIESEITLLGDARITHVVSKNSGGSETVEKLAAARALRIPVIMVARPAKPDVESYDNLDAIAAIIASR
jgi:precorrin-6A/cobalt-precorrin-6A reductase